MRLNVQNAIGPRRFAPIIEGSVEFDGHEAPKKEEAYFTS